MIDGVEVRGLCRLVHFSDVLLLQLISHYPGTMRRSIVILVAKSISKALPSKWYPQWCPARCPATPHHRHYYQGAQGVIWHPCRMSPRHGQNPLRLGPWKPDSLAGSVLPTVDELSCGHRSTGYSWKRDSSPQITWDQAATVKFCHLRAQSRALLKRSSRTLLKNTYSWRAVVFRWSCWLP